MIQCFSLTESTNQAKSANATPVTTSRSQRTNPSAPSDSVQSGIDEKPEIPPETFNCASENIENNIVSSSPPSSTTSTIDGRKEVTTSSTSYSRSDQSSCSSCIPNLNDSQRKSEKVWTITSV